MDNSVFAVAKEELVIAIGLIIPVRKPLGKAD
jgi:hypothetical protein